MSDSFDLGAVRNKGSGSGGSTMNDWDSDSDLQQDPPIKALTQEEVLALRAKNPWLSSMSPWRIVAAQAVVGLVCACAVWILTQRSSAAWSALYGAAVVVMPGALLARGMTKARDGRNPAAAAAGFMFWELVKLVVAATMLVLVAKFAPDLSWPALLVAMVVCMKLGWLVLLWRRPQRAKLVQQQKRV